jgi:hypothetical protein
MIVTGFVKGLPSKQTLFRAFQIAQHTAAIPKCGTVSLKVTKYHTKANIVQMI